MLKSAKTNTLADWLIESNSLMLDEIAPKTLVRDKGDDKKKKKKIKTLIEIKPIKNT